MLLWTRHSFYRGERLPFSGEQFSVIPQNCPHTTTSDPGTLSRWEYIFIDAEEILKNLYTSGNNENKDGWIIQNVNSRGAFFNVSDMPDAAGKILQALDIIRNKEVFYMEEAKGF